MQEPDYYPSTDFGYRLLTYHLRNDPSSGSTYEFESKYDAELRVGDKKQFTREIANLTNKRKTFLGVTAPEKGFLKIEVNDTGCGIKTEDIQKLFKKFSQTSSDSAQLKVGSGLGLWITRTLCQLMGR